MRTLKLSLNKFLIFGIVLISFCLVFAGCNLTTDTPSHTKVETVTEKAGSPRLAQGFVSISEEEYNAIPENKRPEVYKNDNGTYTQQSEPNWNYEYAYYSPFAGLAQGSYVLTIDNAEADKTRGYIFGFFDGEFEKDAEGNDIYDLEKFNKLTILNNNLKPSQSLGVCDITGLVSQPKTYYFYVQALGAGFKTINGTKYNFQNSEPSQVYVYNVVGNLNSLSVENSGNIISWQAVENVKEYEVLFSTNNTNFSKIARTNNTTCNLEELAGFTVPTGTYYIKINAIANDYYISCESEVLTLTNIVTLSTPLGLEVDASFLASWDSVNYAESYELTLILPSGEEKLICNIAQLEYDLSSEINSIGKYYLKVKAVANGTTAISGYYSDYISFTKTQQLESPTNLTYSYIGYYVKLSWDPVEGAESYSIFLTVGSKNLTYTNSCTSNNYTISLKDIVRNLNLEGAIEEGEKFNSFKLSLKANGYDYYLPSALTEKTIENKKLSDPELSILGNNLVWDTVEDAQEYQVVVQEIGYNQKQTNNYLNLNFLQNQGTTFNIKVTAISDIFKNSNQSQREYVIYSKLDAAAYLTVLNDSDNKQIGFSWQNVENAQKYTIYLDLSKSELAQEATPVSGEDIITLADNITGTEFTISYEQLLDKCSGNKYLSYYFYVVCKGYDTYLSSEKTVFQFYNLTLSEPNAYYYNKEIKWQMLENADCYNLYLKNSENEFILVNENISKSTTVINISSYLNVTDIYEFMLEACSNFFVNNSKTIEVNYNAGQLDAPSLSIVGSTISWPVVDNAEYYKLFVNGELIKDDIIATEFNLSAICVEYGTYVISVQACSNHNDPSDIAQINYYYSDDSSFALLAVDANTVQFNTVDFAESYSIYLNNTIVDTISPTAYATITYNFEDALSAFNKTSTDAVTLTVSANGLNLKTFSNCEYVWKKNTNATEFYYVFDRYYDNYIDSFTELVYVNLYSFVFNTTINIILNYTCDNFISEIEAANGSGGQVGKLLSTYKYSYNADVVGNVATICFTSSYLDDKTYQSTCSKNQNNPLFVNYVPTSVRTSSNFVTDNYAIGLEVKNSDMLFWALQFGARPVFDSTNAVSEKMLNYYLQAKNILNSILPENATDYEKALIIAEYIMANSFYDSNYSSVTGQNKYSSKYHFLEGFFDDGLIVCDGYAKIYSLLCNMEGIKNYVVSGYDGGSHAWNKVYLDIDGAGATYQPAWYMVDLTWCDQSGIKLEGKQAFNHNYFLLSDDNALISDRTTNSSYYPQATTSFDYYKTQFNKLGVYLHSSMYEGSGATKLENYLTAIIYQMYAKNQTCIDFVLDKNIVSGEFTEEISTALRNVLSSLNSNYGIEFTSCNYSYCTRGSSEFTVMLTIDY